MSAADELISVRDLLRYAVSHFNAAELSYGHGTGNALDEAAFLTLEGLHLPVDDINPWLDARLTLEERRRLIGLYDARIQTRKPAPYLVGKAYIQGIPFRVDERVIIPRSFIAELLLGGELGPEQLGLIPDPELIGSALDLCTGSGCLAIIAAMCLPNAEIDAVDLSADALEVAALNVADHDVEDRVRLLQGDLFGPVGAATYDLIITNPPYVASAEVEAFPPEYASEPIMAHLGGDDGLELVRRIIDEAAGYLNPDGGLICEIGTGRKLLEDGYPELPFLWLDTEESEGEVFWLPAVHLQNMTKD